jgi:hypothetical protein
MRTLIILLLCLLGCGAGSKPIISPIVPVVPISKLIPVTPAKTPIREADLLHRRIKDYTVALIKVEIEKGEKTSYPYCTGVWVGVDEILTASHCVIDENKPLPIPLGREVTYSVSSDMDGEYLNYHRGKVVYVDESTDLILIQVNLDKMPIHPFVRLAMELPAIGEDVYGLGHPDKLYWLFVSGEVSTYRRSSEIGDVLVANISIWYGDSGGGLFDRYGDLIGICSRIIEVPSMSYYTHLDSIKKFMEEAHMIREARRTLAK